MEATYPLCHKEPATNESGEHCLKLKYFQVGYLASLGQARTAQVKRDALIGEAEAKRDSGIEEAKAEEQRMEAKLKNDTDIAMSKRDFELKKATYDTEVNTAKAEAEMAYALQAAKVQARIKEEEMQVKVVERLVLSHEDKNNKNNEDINS